LREGSGLAGEGVSNNFAEYSALVAALNELQRLGIKEDVIIKSDSKLVVNQMNGKWKGKKGGYLEKFREAYGLAKKFERLAFVWIPREKNTEADALSRDAYETYCRSHGLRARYRQVSSST
jgi:ribonuclease HI